MIGAISVPRSVMHHWQEHETLDAVEAEMVERLPEVGAKLLAAIPRLTGVAQTVRYQNKRFDGGGFPGDAVKGSEIPLNARVLALAKAFIREIGAGDAPKHIVDAFRRDKGRFDPDVLEKAAAMLRDFDTAAQQAGEVVEAEPQNLMNGDELIDRIVTTEGTVVLGTGFVLTEAILTKLRHIRRTTTLRGPIRVRRR
jgi:HD-GYP domain-containing protein (c-di-GMP phosphodiesterase class II)